jgi:hypothetical protein
MIREYGYEWALFPSGLSTPETISLIKLKKALKNTVYESTQGWHSNKYEVWLRFRTYTKKVGARYEAMKLINKIRQEARK